MDAVCLVVYCDKLTNQHKIYAKNKMEKLQCGSSLCNVELRADSPQSEQLQGIAIMWLKLSTQKSSKVWDSCRLLQHLKKNTKSLLAKKDCQEGQYTVWFMIEELF